MTAPYSQAFVPGLYRQVHVIRVFATRSIQLCRQGLIRNCFQAYLGEKAIAVCVCAALGSKLQAKDNLGTVFTSDAGVMSGIFGACLAIGVPGPPGLPGRQRIEARVLCRLVPAGIVTALLLVLALSRASRRNPQS